MQMPINARQVRSRQVEQAIVVRLAPYMFRLQIVLHRLIWPAQFRRHATGGIERRSIFQARSMLPIIVGSQADKRIRSMFAVTLIPSLRK